MPKIEASEHRKRNHHPPLPQARFRTLRADRFTFEYDRFDSSLRLSWSGGQQFMSSGDMRQLYGFIRRISEPAEQATASPRIVRRAGLATEPRVRKAEQSKDLQQTETTKETDPLTKEFPVTSITRENLKQVDFTAAQISTLTDEDMRHIASRMEDTYFDNGYWDDIYTHATFVLERGKDNT